MRRRPAPRSNVRCWYYSKNQAGFWAGQRLSVNEPFPAMMAHGAGGDSYTHWRVAVDPDALEEAVVGAVEKPPYRVPLMAEVRAMPWNGLTVASTFAGCGGSSTGYRMAGYRVLWANEFVPVARDSYAANMRDGTVLDGRDIRDVAGADVLRACGLSAGELDVFDGSPPCQAFSTAGKRAKGWGSEKEYEHGARQRNEELFPEYTRLVRDVQPRVFVAENVSGLVRGAAKGFFLEALAGLKACGYRVSARLLDAQWLGVPQTRSRIIIVGVRADLELDPMFPSPLPYRYSVRDACPWIATVRSGPTGFGAGSLQADRPAPAVSASMQSPYSAHEVTTIDYRSVDGVVRRRGVEEPAPTVTARGMGGAAMDQTRLKTFNGSRSLDEPSSPAVLTHARESTRNEMTVETRMVVGNDAFEPKFGSLDGPSPTAAGARTSGLLEETRADGVHRRMFTIEELKRICSFPDDFVLSGSYRQQWERLGNSVPPLMMRAVAERLRDGVLLPAREARARTSTATPRGPGMARAASRAESSAGGPSRGARTRGPGRPAPSSGAT